MRLVQTRFEQVGAGGGIGLRLHPFDSTGSTLLLWNGGGLPGTPRATKMSQRSNAYRRYYYYGSLSARRDGAAMGCPGVTTI